MLTDTQIRTLMDIASAGAHNGLVHPARQIYDGILAVRPEYVPALIAKAVSYAVVNQFEEAETLLKDAVLQKNPDDADALAMLGLTYILGKRHDEARAVLEPLVAGSGPSAQLARELLAAEAV